MWPAKHCCNHQTTKREEKIKTSSCNQRMRYKSFDLRFFVACRWRSLISMNFSYFSVGTRNKIDWKCFELKHFFSFNDVLIGHEECNDSLDVPWAKPDERMTVLGWKEVTRLGTIHCEDAVRIANQLLWIISRAITSRDFSRVILMGSHNRNDYHQLKRAFVDCGADYVSLIHSCLRDDD